MTPIPWRLNNRPRDRRGYPIPFTVVVRGGVPDFRVSDPDRWLQSVDRRLCALCGQDLHPRRGGWFVGGPLCAVNRVFLDPPMHVECAEYALRVCPFLAAPRGHFSNLDQRPPPPGNTAVAAVSTERPDRFMLGRSLNWQRRPLGETMAIVAQPWTALRWWRHGEVLS